jgi:hypothetical protein
VRVVSEIRVEKYKTAGRSEGKMSLTEKIRMIGWGRVDKSGSFQWRALVIT